jgi:hypothetical protein
MLSASSPSAPKAEPAVPPPSFFERIVGRVKSLFRSLFG